MEKILQPDQESITLLSQGNTTMFTRIFTSMYKPLVLFAYTFVQEREPAEDIVQAFFCKLWEERKTLTHIQNPKSYFYQAIRNSCQNYIRHRKVMANLPLPKEEQHENILQLIMEEEIYQELIRGIDRLPPKCRRIILLKLEGTDTAAIASECNISEETVRSQYRHGIVLLRKELGKTMKEWIWLITTLLLH